MNNLARIDGIRMTKIQTFIFHVVAFILPTIALAKLFNYDPKEAIIFRKPKNSLWLWTPVLFILFFLTNQFLYIVNHQIDFSFVSQSLQESLVYQQALMEKGLNAYIGESWRSYFVNLFLIALIPAISEELLFRGLLQNLLSKATRNVWIGISLSAFLFAIIHFQPFNFLPIFVLGFCYGLVAAYTGSLWIPMVLHFLNNAITLTLAHFQKMFNWPEYEISEMVGIGIIVLFTGIIYWVIKTQKISSKWHETKGIYLR